MVLGGPVPEGLRAALTGVIDLVPEGASNDGEIDGVLIYAKQESLAVFRKFRRAGGALAIFALSEGPVDLNARLQWIRYGADDLLDPATAAETLTRKLQSPATHSADIAEQTTRGMYLDRYLRGLHRYLGARNEILGTLGEGGLTRYLDTAFLRDQVLRADDNDQPADAFGQRRGGLREMLRWPMQIIEPTSNTGEVLNIGADGMSISLAHAPPERMRMALEAGNVAATLDVDVRWQRRVARDRWEVGALITAIQIVRGG